MSVGRLTKAAKGRRRDPGVAHFPESGQQRHKFSNHVHVANDHFPWEVQMR